MKTEPNYVSNDANSLLSFIRYSLTTKTKVL